MTRVRVIQAAIVAAAGLAAGLTLSLTGGGPSLSLYVQGRATGPCSQAAPCSNFQAAYQAAIPGDTVLLNWDGAVAATEKIGPAGSKASAADCRAPADEAGCIRFQPAPGMSPSIIGSVKVCANYVELDKLAITGTLIADGFGGQISSGGLSVGSGDSTCQPNGGPPHDFLIETPTITSAGLYLLGSSHDGYVQGGSIGNGSVNISNQFGGVGNNGLDTFPVNHVTVDGTVFQGMTWTDPTHHHPECLHMDYADDSNSLIAAKFLGCRVFAIRVEAEGSPSKHQDSQTNNLFDGVVTDTVPVVFDCHDPNCVMTGNVVQNSQLAGGIALTNDCNLVAGRTCTASGNVVTGSAINGGCPSAAKPYGLGWTEDHNSWPNITPPPSAASICAGDTTSTFGTVAPKAPPAPSEDESTGAPEEAS